MTTQAERESHQFQAEVVQLLDLMINSLYSNKEIFLRELISNGSDAIDRLRFAAFSEPSLAPADGEKLQIRVAFDKAARTITVSDNGIGMSRDEVIEQIGTIAKSGTREFLRSLSGDQRKDAALIGQFGVGFYSAFVVADRVTLVTRKAGLDADQAVRWESDGKGAYSVENIQRDGRGTDVTLHLRAGEDDLLHGYRLKSIIQKYSDHISLPIVMPAGDGAGREGPEGDGDGGEQTVNQGSALWARSKSDLSEQDYQDFYKHVAGDFAAPLAYLHAVIEGTYEYTLLLFIPSRAPFDLWLPDARRGVKLHVRRVFIMEDTGQLMPVYLRFIRGVIDSADLPLNVSRELLQSSRVVDSIRSSAVKRILKLLRDLASDEPAKYAAFWKEFGSVLKEGVAEDYANRAEIAKLLRFRSTRSAGDEPDVSLDDYVGRMKEGQEKIYYLLAPTPAAAASSPLLETYRKQGVEVLLFGEAVDHWVASSLQDFDGKRLVSAGQEVPDFGDEAGEKDEEAAKEAAAGFAGLTGKLKEALGGKVHEVRVSSRLTTSPACIVPDEPEIGLSLMRRISGSGLPDQPVLEINPGHPLIARLNASADDPHLGEWAEVLYSQAVLTLGAQIEDPAVFVSQLNDLLVALAGEG